MLLTFVDAIFLCAFYAVICYVFAPFALVQNTAYLHLAPLALLPLAGRFLMRLFIAKVIAKISYTVEGAVREELVNKLLRVGPLSFAVKSSLSPLFVDALDDIMPYFSSFLVTLRYAMVIPVICVIAVALVSPWSALILIAMAPMIPFFMILIGKGAERLNQRQWKQITRLAVRFQEALDKLSLIKLFNIESSEIEKIARLTKRWRVETMQVLRIAFLSALVLEFFATCGIALCAITLGFAVYEHGFDFTKALFVLLLAPEFFLPLRQLGFTYHSRMRALGAMSSLMELLGERDIFTNGRRVTSHSSASAQAQQAHCQHGQGTATAVLEASVAVANDDPAALAAISDPTGATSVATSAASSSFDVDASADSKCAAVAASAEQADDPDWMQAPFTIEFNQVTATYPNGRVGLDNFSCRLEPSCVSALVGPSGAGKSTILQTIAGFTNVSSGQIIINGHACSRQDLINLMAKVSYIPQLPNLFYGTLRDNLKLGAPESSDEQLLAALDMVGASDLISRFADGLDHHVGDQNRGISGGETRLIALARAMLHDSSILLLDEPTASLDRDSENRFLQALKSIGQDKTVIIVAHRTELIAFAQHVITVEPSSISDPADATDHLAASSSTSATSPAPASGSGQGTTSGLSKSQGQSQGEDKVRGDGPNNGQSGAYVDQETKEGQ